MPLTESLAIETMGTELIPIDAREQMSKALEYCASVVEITIQDDEQYNAASMQVSDIGKTLKALEARRKEVKQPWADKATKVDREFKGVTDKLGNLDRQIRTAMSSYYAKITAEAERKRREAEAIAAEERRKAEEVARKEREKAEQYREQGRNVMAEKADARADYAIETAATTVAPVIEPPKTEGATMVDAWTVRVVDKSKAVAACMANPMFAAAVLVDAGFLSKLESAKHIRGAVPIDGCEIKYTPYPRRK